jgi:protein-S-isoprenylcysteine O-methyltransferase Ste14
MMPRWAYGALLAALWIAWVIYWMIRSRGVKAIVRQESIASRLTYLVPSAIGGVLILYRRPGTGLAASYLPYDARLAAYWIGIALIVVGLGFSIWAREYLGGNWSATVTLKESHELVRTGPYAWVRHPIYTGLLIALLGCAVAQGERGGLIGFGLLIAAFVRKLKIEERFLGDLFGEQYARYRKEVAALVPGLY